MLYSFPYIDLRSDTVTHPTPEMRKAMAEAEVGDDVYREDPTVNCLEELAAEKMGKEAGLFVASGTMGNLIAVLAQSSRGDEAIMGDLGHTFLFEGGGISAFGGVFAHIIPNQPDGTLDICDLETAIRPIDIHCPISRLIILENTHNHCGGVPISAAYTKQVGDLAHTRGLRLHLDGARIFNAAVALNTSAKELAAPADTVLFCLSKGLCAPVGSVICGSRALISKMRRIRKQLGGGMRQAGILAAAGIIALEKMVERLAEDHYHAKLLADGLAQINGLELYKGMPQTNMVFISMKEKDKQAVGEVKEKLKSKKILVGIVDRRHFRLVTHYWIDRKDINAVITAFSEVI
ncbi:MAG TPA: low-specificity L-threonine aldolase [Anaerolineae bacterium]|nr:low-specificity L-threonine aldolase [Anaerolineae bacterium]